MKLYYKTRRDDPEADKCKACVQDDIKKMPKQIADWQDILDFAREQMEEQKKVDEKEQKDEERMVKEELEKRRK